MSRSESVSDLNGEYGSAAALRARGTFGKEGEASPSKPFGLGKCL